MDILYWLVKIFIWAIALAFSVIPGVIAGYFGEVLLGRIGYWLGFAIGVLIFLINMGPLLTFNDDEPPEEEHHQQRRESSLFSFLAGLWLGSKFFGKDD